MDKKLTYWLASIIGVVVLATGMTYGILQFAEVPMGSENMFLQRLIKKTYYRMKQK